MRKIEKKFEEIWTKADTRNKKEGQRFHRIHGQSPHGKGYLIMGVYDSRTKKHCVFDTINLIGNFRYNAQIVPDELNEMDRIISLN